MVNPDPQMIPPDDIVGDNVCQFSSAAAAARIAMPWHGQTHTTVGGAFSSFDSPSNPWFFIWHNSINDVWLDYQNCESYGDNDGSGTIPVITPPPPVPPPPVVPPTIT